MVLDVDGELANLRWVPSSWYGEADEGERGAVGVGFDVRGVHASAHDGDAVAAEPGLFRCRSPLAAVPDDHRDVPFVADPGEVTIDRDVADSPNPSRGADGGTTIRGEPLIPLSVNRIRRLPNEQRQASA
jgi:hypothetical protein